MLSIIIPTYNEQGNIKLLVSRLEKSVLAEHEIIIVDDNSPDGTAAVVRQLAKTNPNLRLIMRERKDGLTGAVVAGAKAAKGDSLVVMDADLSHPPEMAAKLYGNLVECDLVVGSRFVDNCKVDNWPMKRDLISKTATLLSRVFIRVKITDPMSGFFAVKKEIFLKTHFRTKGYKILLNVLYDNSKLRIKEIHYCFAARHSGETKLTTSEITNYIFDLIRLLRK